MPISHLCTKDLISVSQGTSLQSAAQLMKKHHVGGLVVVESASKSKPVGILTDRDLAMAIVADNWSADSPVDKVMSKKVIKVKQTEGISKVIEKMSSEGIRRIILVDDDDNACGLVSSDDILQLMAKELNDLGNLVKKQVNPDSLREPRSSQVMFL